MRAHAFRKGLASLYTPPAVKSYTDACEAPVAMWNGAIPLKRTLVKKNGNFVNVVKKTYSHPPEVLPTQLNFNDIDSMYCIGNDELIRYFPEGLGGKVMQLMPPGHPRGFLYRKESHLLNTFIHKFTFWATKRGVISTLSNGRPGFILDGPTGCGKSALICQAVHFARSRNILTLYVPNAKKWTHGEWCWPSVILPGFFDAPDAAREFLQYFVISNRSILENWPLRCTPSDLPIDQGETPPRTLLQLCEWGHQAVAPVSIDRQSVCIKFLFDELSAEKEKPILIAVDGWNLFSHNTHFRYPHPDFLHMLTSLADKNTDVDLYPQELPRIPSSRLSFVRGLNKFILSHDEPNKFFITCTTRDFKPFDGISGFPDVEKDRFKNSLDEYAPYYPEKDSFFHPIQIGNFTEYEYRAFLRFVINSGELCGLGWGPMWHYSSDFERKLYKIGFLSDRNPQRVIDHYHQEMVWRYEYKRARQKQFLLSRRKAYFVSQGQASNPIVLGNIMTRKGKREQLPIHRNFDGLKRFYDVLPLPTHKRTAIPSYFVGAYSRRGILSSYHIIGNNNRMDKILSAAKTIRSGESIPMETVIEALHHAGAVCAAYPHMVRVTGSTVVVGPIRGHASDFANYIHTTNLLNKDVENIVLLGNYIDGSHQSIEVLYLVSLLVSHSGKKVVPLLGKHELLYPMQPEFFGSLQNELILRSIHSNTDVEIYEKEVRNFFSTLPIVCLIDEVFFCVAGGPASGFRLISQIEAEPLGESLWEFVVNSRISEREEMVSGKYIFVASQHDRAFLYTFNAACNFISRNNLATLIVGMEYHTNCPDGDGLTRPSHSEESIYFPGFVIDKIHPETQIPAAISIFSAPCFCGNNRNNACILEVANKSLTIRELKVYNERPLIMPGKQNHAFSWAEPMLENALAKVAQELIFGSIPQQPPSEEEEDYRNRESHARAKMRRMCQLLKFFNLPLPKFAWN